MSADTSGQVVVVHGGGVAGAARELAVRLRAQGFGARVMPLDELGDDPGVAEESDVITVAIEPDPSDVARLCHDVATNTARPVVAVAVDPDSADAVDDDVAIAALEAGADDVVPVTAADRVLAARLRAAIRAHPAQPAHDTPIEIGDLRIHPHDRLLVIDDSPRAITPIQFDLLLMFARHVGELINTERLLAEVWGISHDVDQRRVRLAIMGLRRVLGAGPRRPNIETVARRGYRLVARIA